MLQTRVDLFNTLLNGYNNQLFLQKQWMKCHFQRTQIFYKKYLLDLELYIRQFKRFLTVLLGSLVMVVTYILHFVLFTNIPVVMIIWAIIVLIGHLMSIGTLIFSSVRVSFFNKQYSRWYFGIIQHCSARKLNLFNNIQSIKVKLFDFQSRIFHFKPISIL